MLRYSVVVSLLGGMFVQIKTARKRLVDMSPISRIIPREHVLRLGRDRYVRVRNWSSEIIFNPYTQPVVSEILPTLVHYLRKSIPAYAVVAAFLKVLIFLHL